MWNSHRFHSEVINGWLLQDRRYHDYLTLHGIVLHLIHYLIVSVLYELFVDVYVLDKLLHDDDYSFEIIVLLGLYKWILYMLAFLRVGL